MASYGEQMLAEYHVNNILINPVQIYLRVDRVDEREPS